VVVVLMLLMVAILPGDRSGVVFVSGGRSAASADEPPLSVF
jgi:hypothetical protein